MNALHMLDVTIGLIVIFLLVSLICCAISEVMDGIQLRLSQDIAGLKKFITVN